MRNRPPRLAVTAILLALAAAPARAGDVRYTVPAESSPSIGPANAPVTIVEFLDYQ